MTYKELKEVIIFNTEASWQKENIVEALELYLKGIVEQLEDASCYIEDGDGHAGHLIFTDEAIEIVKGGAE